MAGISVVVTGVFKSLASMWEIIARTSPDIKVAIRTDVNCSVYK